MSKQSLIRRCRCKITACEPPHKVQVTNVVNHSHVTVGLSEKDFAIHAGHHRATGKVEQNGHTATFGQLLHWDFS